MNAKLIAGPESDVTETRIWIGTFERCHRPQEAFSVVAVATVQPHSNAPSSMLIFFAASRNVADDQFTRVRIVVPGHAVGQRNSYVSAYGVRKNFWSLRDFGAARRCARIWLELLTKARVNFGLNQDNLLKSLTLSTGERARPLADRHRRRKLP
jgi:hypothetical protein